MYNPYASAVDESLGQQNLHHPRPQHVPQQSFGGKQQYTAHNPQTQAPSAQGSQQYAQQYQQQHQQQYPQQYPQQQAPQAQYPAAQYGGQYAAEFQGNTPNFQPPGQAGPGGAYGDFFSDPAASMAAQFAKSSFGSSNGYLQQNFGSYMPVAGELKYYFKVSNAYVWRKLALILFPYRHRDWTRIRSVESGGAASSGPCFAPACEDVNAPDLYIPLMALVSYVLLWASFSGLRGDFHPEVFGFVASQTLACSFVDILIFRVGLYLLNCSAQTSFWDLISFSGYKYVTIIALLCWKQVAGSSWLMYYGVLLAAVSSLSLFLMRSLKFLILPHGSGENPAASISNGQRRLRVQFLFIYSVVVQFLIVLFMCRY